jgi:hypothetical protein
LKINESFRQKEYIYNTKASGFFSLISLAPADLFLKLKMVCPYRLVVALITGLAVLYIAAKEFIFVEDESMKKKKKSYKLWDYYTGKWAYDLFTGNQYVQDESTQKEQVKDESTLIN